MELSARSGLSHSTLGTRGTWVRSVTGPASPTAPWVVLRMRSVVITSTVTSVARATVTWYLNITFIIINDIDNYIKDWTCIYDPPCECSFDAECENSTSQPNPPSSQTTPTTTETSLSSSTKDVTTRPTTGPTTTNTPTTTTDLSDLSREGINCEYIGEVYYKIKIIIFLYLFFQTT